MLKKSRPEHRKEQKGKPVKPESGSGLEKAPKDHYLRNEEVVYRILESGTPEEVEELRDFHDLTPEQIDLAAHYVKLRKEVLEQMYKDLGKRVKESPQPTEEELNIGTYKENIEPQVREAVFNLRNKGYTTFESGFYDPGEQKIGFQQDHLEGFKFPEKLLNELESEGVKVKVEPDSISFTCNTRFQLDEIKEVWSRIESALPDLGGPADLHNHGLGFKYFP